MSVKSDNESTHSRSSRAAGSIRGMAAATAALSISNILSIITVISSLASLGTFIFIAVTIGRSVVCGPGLNANGFPSQRLEDRICVVRTTGSLFLGNWASGFQNGGAAFAKGASFQMAEDPVPASGPQQ